MTCTDPDCAAPTHGDSPRPALKCKGCGKRMDNPVCHDCHGNINAAAAETAYILKLRDERDEARKRLVEAASEARKCAIDLAALLAKQEKP